MSYDRLTTLIDRFKLTLHPAAAAASLIVTQDDGGLAVQFTPRAALLKGDAAHVVFAAIVDWGGADNPLMAALPERVEHHLSPEDGALISLLQSELAAPRCGGGAVINRLAEVLIIRLLRALIAAGTAQPGLLAGLADPRLSRAIVALHDHPGRDWRSEDLAQIAGLSRSRFMQSFADIMGQPPAAYLRSWRMTLAHQDIARGDRIETVARRYGYGSPEGFARAFKRRYGGSPMDLRRAA